MKERVIAAMSGGVDSAVAAALAVEQGYEVIGITMQVWPEGKPVPASARGCCSVDTVEDARRVAQFLGIPHYVLNMREEFDQTVIHNFIHEYQSGRTPNPCVECNRHIKFAALWERADALGARLISTGHYARIRFDEDVRRWELLKAKDPGKDQSYVLHPLTQEQLSRTLFPLGEWTKSETRSRAFELGLKVAAKADSQEICFVPDRNYGSFLESVAPESVRPGRIVDTSGRVRGEHRGVAFFTIGQRKGLGVSAPTPLYVTRIDAAENLVVIGGNDEVASRTCRVAGVNWVSIPAPSSSIRVESRVRYNMTDAPATIAPSDDGAWRLTFDRSQRAMAPGQSAVFYEGERLLGGGTIIEIEDDDDDN